MYYYLGEYDESLSFALGAGSAFEAEARASGSEEYVETVVCAYSQPLCVLASSFTAKAIDRYIALRVTETAGGKQESVDPRLQTIVEGIFQRCIEDGEFKQVRDASNN